MKGVCKIEWSYIKFSNNYYEWENGVVTSSTTYTIEGKAMLSTSRLQQLEIQYISTFYNNFPNPEGFKQETPIK